MTDIHPTRLYLLRLGGGDIPADPPEAASFGSYLIQVSDGRNVLINTGVPPGRDGSERTPTIDEHVARANLARFAWPGWLS